MNSNVSFWAHVTVVLLLLGLLGCDNSDGLTQEEQQSTPDPESTPEPELGASFVESGFITLPDGVDLKYTAYLPSEHGRYPTIVLYDGYSAGSQSVEASLGLAKFLNEGYAVVGLSVRGTGCSTGGPWDVFNPQWGRDGAFAIDWLADRPWSTGKLGMWGVSFGGYMQLWVASFQPEHLKAIAPAGVVTDLLRDVPRPGGVPNVIFPGVWWASLNQTWIDGGTQGAEQGHPECLTIAAANVANNHDESVPEAMLKVTHESEYSLYRSANQYTHNIEVPTLLHYSWQDEQVSSRGGYVEDTINPELLWLVGGNGGHTSYFMREYQDHVLQFYDHFLKDKSNGFEDVGRVQVWNEIKNGGSTSWNTLENSLGWVTEIPDWPIPIKPLRLHLHQGGEMKSELPEANEVADSYAYPMLGPTMTGANDYDWKVPATPGSSVVYTTAPLPENLNFFGPASADLWFSSTAQDTDIQVTVTEVRPDGQETYVQRGWLRASQRAQDPAFSSTLRPYLIQTMESEKPLIPGQPELLRVEINKFAHTFRQGSSIRMTVDTPTLTGLWGFNLTPEPAQNTVWHDSKYPSSLVLGYLHSDAGQPMPACDSVAGQPCRPNTQSVPEGVGPAPPN